MFKTQAIRKLSHTDLDEGARYVLIGQRGGEGQYGEGGGGGAVYVNARSKQVEIEEPPASTPTVAGSHIPTLCSKRMWVYVNVCVCVCKIWDSQMRLNGVLNVQAMFDQ